MQWQQRALRVVDLIPELDYASRFYSRMLAPLRLFPAIRSKNGELTEIMSGPPVELLNRIRDTGGGRAQILGSYGRLMFITGEGNLLGYDLETADENWIFVWNDELSVERGKDNSITKIIWKPAETSNPREFSPEEAVVYKLWLPHPRRSGEATSPLRAIVEGDIAEEMIALTRSVRATAVSRAVRGVLVIPQEISPPPLSNEGDEDPEVNPWISQIADHFEAQIEQIGSAAAAAPYLMEVAYEYIDRIRLIELHNPQHDYLERELRNEAVERMARGVDFPVEALTGLGRTNHWAAMQILMDMWRSHGLPIAQRFCDDLVTVYLRPALREEKYPNAENIVIGIDAAEVTVKPDRSDDARTAIQHGAIGPGGFRKMLNIPDDYAMTEEEWTRYREVRSRGSTGPARDPERAPEGGPAPPGPEGDSGRRTRVTASANGRREPDILELALMRCRELAGIRIRQKAQRAHPEVMAQIEKIPFSSVASVLGTDTLKQMGISNTIALVSGGADNLRSLLLAWGYAAEQADLFGEIVEMHAAKTLFEADFPELTMDFSAVADQLGEAA